MFNEEIMKSFQEIYSNPLFKKNFTDFFVKAQQEGVEAARKSWEFCQEKNKFFKNTPDVFEQMTDFYSNLGFVSIKKYEEILKENDELKKANTFLKNTIKELNLKVITEGGKKVQEAWTSTVDKQMETSKEIAQNFFDFFKQPEKK